MTLDRNSNKPGSLDTNGCSNVRSSEDESPKPESYELLPDFQATSLDITLFPPSDVIISSEGTFQYSSEDSAIGSIVLIVVSLTLFFI